MTGQGGAGIGLRPKQKLSRWAGLLGGLSENEERLLLNPEFFSLQAGLGEGFLSVYRG